MNSNELDEVASAFGKLYLRLMRLLDRRLAEQGATLARTKLLLFLHRHGPKRAADVADYFGQAPRTVTEAIDGLERAGLVRREQDGDDRRAKNVVLTEAGERAVAATEPLRQQIVEEVFGGLTRAEADQFRAVLAKLDAAVSAVESQ